MTFFPQSDIAVKIRNFKNNEVIYYDGTSLGITSSGVNENQYWYLIPGEGKYGIYYKIKHFQTGKVLAWSGSGLEVVMVNDQTNDDKQYWSTTWGVAAHSGCSLLREKTWSTHLYGNSESGKLALYGPGPYDDQYWKFTPDDSVMPVERSKRDLGLTATVVGTIASVIGAGATVYGVIPATDTSFYIKLTISNVTNLSFYLAEMKGPELDFIQSTILRGTTAVLMCRSNSTPLAGEMIFWADENLFDTVSWKTQAFYISVSSKKEDGKLVIKKCNKGDSIETVRAGGVLVMDLGRGAERPRITDYKNFYSSWIYASVSGDSSKKMEINIQIGGDPF